MTDVNCRKCGQRLYYSGGCLGEWEHLSGSKCPAKTTPKVDEKRDLERAREIVLRLHDDALRGATWDRDRLQAEIATALAGAKREEREAILAILAQAARDAKVAQDVLTPDDTVPSEERKTIARIEGAIRARGKQ